MMKGLLGVFIAAVLFAVGVYIILDLLGVLAMIVGFLVALGILAFVLVFIVLFAFGFVLFFAALYFMIEKKPTVRPGDYTLDMEKGKNE
jgi:hypothetical protein